MPPRTLLVLLIYVVTIKTYTLLPHTKHFNSNNFKRENNKLRGYPLEKITLRVTCEA